MELQFNNIIPKSYEGFQDLLLKLNLPDRLKAMNYHTPLIENSASYETQINREQFIFLLCPCTQEFTDYIDIKNWVPGSSVVCSDCGRVFSDKEDLHLTEDLLELNKNIIKINELQATGAALLTEELIDERELIRNNSKIIDLKEDLYDKSYSSLDYLVKILYKNVRVSASNFNSISFVNVKDDDSIKSVTTGTLTVHLLKTSKNPEKLIYKTSIRRNTLSFNKLDKQLRMSSYYSGIYAIPRERRIKPIPIICTKPIKSIINCSMSPEKVWNMFSNLKSSGDNLNSTKPVKNLPKSELDRILPGYKAIETFYHEVAEILGITLSKPVKNKQNNLLTHHFEIVAHSKKDNIKLINDVAKINLISLLVKLNRSEMKPLQKLLWSIVNRPTETSVRVLLRKALPLSKRGVKLFVELLQIIGKSDFSCEQKQSYVNNLNLLFLISDKSLSYMILDYTLTYIKGTNHRCIFYEIQTSKNLLDTYHFGLKFKQSIKEFYAKMMTTLIRNPQIFNKTRANYHFDDVYGTYNLIELQILCRDLINTLYNTFENISQIKNKDSKDLLISIMSQFLHNQPIKNLHTFEQNLLALIRDFSKNDDYLNVIKSKHLDLNQTATDHKTYDMELPEMTFSIPNHGVEMFTTGQNLKICVGDHDYQRAVRDRKTQIVFADDVASKKRFVIEIDRNNNHIKQVKTYANQRAFEFPTALKPLREYFKKLKLIEDTIDLKGTIY